jgi:hypothetical protein
MTELLALLGRRRVRVAGGAGLLQRPAFAKKTDSARRDARHKGRSRSLRSFAEYGEQVQGGSVRTRANAKPPGDEPKDTHALQRSVPFDRLRINGTQELSARGQLEVQWRVGHS